MFGICARYLLLEQLKDNTNVLYKDATFLVLISPHFVNCYGRFPSYACDNMAIAKSVLDMLLGKMTRAHYANYVKYCLTIYIA